MTYLGLNQLPIYYSDTSKFTQFHLDLTVVF